MCLSLRSMKQGKTQASFIFLAIAFALGRGLQHDAMARLGRIAAERHGLDRR